MKTKIALEPIVALKSLTDLYKEYSPSDWDKDWEEPWRIAVLTVKNAEPPTQDEDFNNRLYYTPYEVGDLFGELWHECKHGDDEHKKWLKDKIDAFYKSRVEIRSKNLK